MGAVRRKAAERRPNLAARLAIGLIHVYQICVSPFLGVRCRFYPSCSQYAVLAITEWGFFRGVWLTAKRLLKCGPWHGGGYDPPPGRRVSG
ncbi:MAG: membrane protein insertion efficiency factor YidD [Synergistaceae bacterium]|nr:membrane protein insertion efficiency factor YidD [Synergistaceae bacterium]